MFHFVYKITRSKSEKFYIGVHSTEDLNDGYFGSGFLIKKSVKKYGRDEHQFTILQFFETRKMALIAEKILVNLETLKDPNCLNLREGGTGILTEPSKEKISNSLKCYFSDDENRKAISRAITEKYATDPNFVINVRNANSNKNTNAKRAKSVKLSWQGDNSCRIENITKGCNSEKEKTLRSEFARTNNPMKGKRWINNGEHSKTINDADLLPSGWNYGRLLKKER